MSTRKVTIHVGVDEAGRGPLAGPITIGAVAMEPALLSRFRGIRDSKRLTITAREWWYERLLVEREKGNLDFAVAHVGSSVIDVTGISRATRLGVYRVLSRLAIEPASSLILLDGLLRASRAFENQRTIIGGDDRRRIIALASIAAKVSRDKKMCVFSKIFPDYRFDVHKGYGTRAHMRAIRKFGPSDIHRLTYLTGLTP